MKIVSLNIRGLGGRTKKRYLIREEHVDLVAIQESKLGIVDKGLCEFLWGDQEVGLAHLPA